MSIDSFEPITREMAAEILKISVGTVDKLVKRGILPRPQPLGDRRRLYWLPEPFFACVRQALQARDSRAMGALIDPPSNVSVTRVGAPIPREQPKPRAAADRAVRRTLARVKRLNS